MLHISLTALENLNTINKIKYLLAYKYIKRLLGTKYQWYVASRSYKTN